MITFDEEKHVYSLEGRILPSVTQILNSEGIIEKPSQGMRWYMLRGQYLHQAIRLYLDRNLDEDSLDPQINIEGFKKFVKESNIEIVGYEQPFYHPQYLYAGTPDMWGKMNGKRFLLDVKTGAYQRWHALQLVAYEKMLQANGIDVDECGNLYLQGGDGYSLKTISQVERIRNWEIFKAILTIYNWKNGG